MKNRLQQSFMRAIEAGDLDKVQSTLADGADANKEHWTFHPLFWLCFTGAPTLAMAKRLLDAGADVHGGKHWSTPLFAAARAKAQSHEGELDAIMQLLRDHGAQDSAFIAIVLNDEPQVAQYLTGDSNLLTVRDEYGSSLLDHTCRRHAIKSDARTTE